VKTFIIKHKEDYYLYTYRRQLDPAILQKGNVHVSMGWDASNNKGLQKSKAEHW